MNESHIHTKWKTMVKVLDNGNKERQIKKIDEEEMFSAKKKISQGVKQEKKKGQRQKN